MKLKRTDWHCIVDQVRYWDAMDLLENLEQELEKARSGMLHYVFEIEPDTSLQLKSYEFTLSPRIRTVGRELRIEFDGMDRVNKNDVNISIESGMLDVLVRYVASDGRESVGRFLMRLPQGIDAETCEAELSKGKLVVCLKKAASPVRKKIEVK
ncbi:MAG: Hsp20/alpha crystallin family protein [Thermoplasmata archaeon]